MTTSDHQTTTAAMKKSYDDFLKHTMPEFNLVTDTSFDSSSKLPMNHRHSVMFQDWDAVTEAVNVIQEHGVEYLIERDYPVLYRFIRAKTDQRLRWKLIVSNDGYVLQLYTTEE